MTNPLAGKRKSTSARAKSLDECKEDLRLAWKKQDIQLGFDHLMNRMKRCIVGMEEINRIPRRWRDIALQRGYIKINDQGQIEPRRTRIGDATTPWEDQDHVRQRAEQRQRMFDLFEEAKGERKA